MQHIGLRIKKKLVAAIIKFILKKTHSVASFQALIQLIKTKQNKGNVTLDASSRLQLRKINL